MSNSGTTSAPRIHSSAVIDATVEIGDGADIGPYAVIGPNVQIGPGTHIAAHVVIERDTQLGADCRVHAGAVLGGDPQDLKYGGETAPLIIGDRTVIREFVTLNRGTSARGRTQIGSDCLIMAYVHVAHDCALGDHVIVANAVNMGGHCDLDDWVIVGGMTAIHQFVHVGAHAFVGGSSAVRKDVPPFVKAAGDPLRLVGLNSVGLQRRGFGDDERASIRRAYRLLFQSKQNLRDAIATARAELGDSRHVRTLLDFIEGSERGITV
ncbi:MAG TPA: acyl-ACP--UDP-N-acetylglucosamine O-acyltransferase [Longimicrobiales bacterium]|nr:acyl-ACP--UDP-N-acetylglucosamine O-acyltransferase [Longimicrobiales bacterium]